MWSPFLCPVGLWEACVPQGVALALCWGFQSSLDNRMLCLQAAVLVWVLAKMIMETEGTVFPPSSLQVAMHLQCRKENPPLDVWRHRNVGNWQFQEEEKEKKMNIYWTAVSTVLGPGHVLSYLVLINLCRWQLLTLLQTRKPIPRGKVTCPRPCYSCWQDRDLESVITAVPLFFLSFLVSWFWVFC